MAARRFLMSWDNCGGSLWSGGCGLLTWLLLSRLGRSIFAGALGLNLGGVEDAVAAVGTHGERLGIILEGVGKRLHALIADADGFIQFHEREVGVSSAANNGAGLHVACDAQVTRVGLVTRLLQLS